MNDFDLLGSSRRLTGPHVYQLQGQRRLLLLPLVVISERQNSKQRKRKKNLVVTLLEIADRVRLFVCSRMCVCVSVSPPVAMTSPPLTSKKELKGAEVMLSDSERIPAKLEKSH